MISFFDQFYVRNSVRLRLFYDSVYTRTGISLLAHLILIVSFFVLLYISEIFELLLSTFVVTPSSDLSSLEGVKEAVISKPSIPDGGVSETVTMDNELYWGYTKTQ
jgi:hypothetical protein